MSSVGASWRLELAVACFSFFILVNRVPWSSSLCMSLSRQIYRILLGVLLFLLAWDLWVFGFDYLCICLKSELSVICSFSCIWNSFRTSVCYSSMISSSPTDCLESVPSTDRWEDIHPLATWQLVFFNKLEHNLCHKETRQQWHCSSLSGCAVAPDRRLRQCAVDWGRRLHRCIVVATSQYERRLMLDLEWNWMSDYFFLFGKMECVSEE